MARSGQRRVRELTWMIWWRSSVASLAVAIAAGVVSTTSVPIFIAKHQTHVIGIVIVIAAVGFAIADSTGYLVVRHVGRRAYSWILEERPPTESEVTRIARIPRFAAKFIAGAWAITVPVMFALGARIVPGIDWIHGLVQTIALIFTFSTIAAAFAAYVFVEHAVRPLLAAVLPADPEAWPRTMGLTSRLLLSTVVVSSAPLVVIAITFGLLDEAQRARSGPAITSAGILFAIIGFLVFLVAGRTITSPLDELRSKFRRVADGDLSAQVDAVEGGEIGLLQVGFNQMVDGLRERERLRDVFGRHVGTEVAKRALESDFGGGEIVHASVLFVDVVGSTALTERSSPQEVVATLNEFFDKVVHVVASEGGYINKFLGDGALCIFGAPTLLDDHAARALRAARTLSAELSTLAGVAAVIGVASGDVVAGDVGAVNRYEYTVVGDAVNEASRLCDAAKMSPSNVLASDRTVGAAPDEAAYWLRAETMQLRGKAKPTVTYVPAAI